jgi:hypothetical protein
MFEEYLRQFPNGKFSGLSKIYIKKLKCGDSHKEKTLDKKTDAGQTLASLAPKEELKPASEMSLAIFPWYFSAPMGVHRDETIEALREIFGKNYTKKLMRSTVILD